MKVLLFLVILFLYHIGFSQENLEVREKMAELHKIKQSIRVHVFERSRKEQEIQRIGIELTNQSEKINQLTKSSSELKKSMQDRAVLLYKMKRASQSESLFTIKKNQEILKKAYFTQLFHKRDRKLSNQFIVTQKSLSKENSQFRNRLVYLKGLRKNSELQLANLKQEEKKHRDLITELKDESVADVDLDSQFSTLRGMMQPPVNKPFQNNFGYRRQKNTELNFLSSGVHFAADGGELVLSPYKGEVSFVGELPYWGKILILDHGNSYFTVYGNLENLSVRLGDQVNSQQKLAQVSNNKYDKVSGLYFEIRHFTEPQNPKEWFLEGVTK